MADPKPQCSVEDCTRPIATRASGLCMTHYQRERRAVGRSLSTETGGPRKAPPPRQGGKWNETQIETALLAIVMQGGDTRAAAEIVGIPHETVRRWASDTHTARYAELRHEKGPELERLAVAGLLGFVHQAEKVKAVALQKTLEELESEKGSKDPGATLRNVATAQGITVTKIMELSGRPTSIVMHRSPQELLSRLARMGAIVDGSATEIEPARLAETNPPVAAQADSTEAGD